jgi:monoamine oxidase
MFRCGEAEKWLPILREPVGGIHFASADWAHGWRGYVDGAMEQGLHAGMRVVQELKARTRPSL